MMAAEFDKAIKCKCCGDVATTGFSTRPLCDCCCVELDTGAIPNVVGPLEPAKCGEPIYDDDPSPWEENNIRILEDWGQ